MKVLLDEMLPISVRQLLPDHQVMTAAYVGLAGVSNGDIDRIRAYADELSETVATITPGRVVRITDQP